jgi:hypothetical protein
MFSRNREDARLQRIQPLRRSIEVLLQIRGGGDKVNSVTFNKSM